jgi:S1-C subfamily serine protease
MEDVRLISARLIRTVETSLVQLYWKGVRKAELTPGFPVANGMFVSVRPGATVAEQVVIRKQGSDYQAKVVLVDPHSGLVLIEGPKGSTPMIPPLPLGSSRGVFISDPLFAVRLNSEGLPEQCVIGVLSGRDRRLEGEPLPVAYLRPRIPESVSLGGLPVLDATGRVVGIDLGNHLDDDGQEFHALPVEVATKLVTDLEDFGKREEAWLGITFNTGTTTPKVVSVRPNSPGGRAGVQPGDIVIQFAGTRIDSLDDLADTCYFLTPGRTAEMAILRGISQIQRSVQPISITAKPAEAEVILPSAPKP